MAVEVSAKPKAGLKTFTDADASRVRSFLEKICASAEFSRSEQMARLLRFLVNQALSSSITITNERTIAVRVFSKSADWDPREDTIVRTEARRLRSKLESYYEGLGKFDRVIISVPKGAYYALIEIRDIAEPDPSDSLAIAASSQPAASARGLQFTFAYKITAFLLGLSTVCLCALLYWESHQHAKTFELDVNPIANAIGQEFSPSVSPDGKRLAYVWDGDRNNLDIYVKDIAGGSPSRLTTDPRPDLYPAWSPDGKSLAFLRKGDQYTDVLIRSLSDGKERVVTQIATEVGRWAGDNSPLLGDPGPVWTQDGKRLIVADADRSKGIGLYSVSIADADRTQLTAPPGEMRDFYPTVSPDGKTLAFVRYFTHGFAQIFSAPIDPTTGRLADSPRQITFDKQAIRGLTWTARGSGLLFASNRHGQFELWSMKIPSGEINLIATDTSSVADPSVSSHLNGVVFVKTTENWNIWRAAISPSGTLGQPQRLLSSTGQNHDPMYSPDGKRVAFVSDRSGEPEIWTSSQNGSDLKQVTSFHGVWIASPVWSPDGKYIGFDARPNGRASIYIVASAGGTPKPLEENAFENRGPVWSSDGKWLYFNSNRSGAVALWKKGFPDGTAVQVGPADSYLSQESRNGKDLVFSDLHGTLFQMDLDTHDVKELRPSVQVNPVVSWTRANESIYFSTRLPDDRSAINRYRSGEVSVIGQTSAPIVGNSKNFSVSPDGHYLLFAQQDSVGSDIMLLRSLDPR